MRQYETAFLISPKLPEEETEKLVQKMADVVAKKKGKMINIEKWGKRKLAYSINNHEEAVYVFFQYEGEPDVPSELERRFRQTETVIRYLTLRKEFQPPPKKPEKRKRREVATEETKEAEANLEDMEIPPEKRPDEEK